MILSWTDKAWEDYLFWQAQDRKILKRINALIKDTQRNPFEGF
ncbi:type II toxin-antitoxin system YoeB family toxin, partial [Kingella kingae]